MQPRPDHRRCTRIALLFLLVAGPAVANLRAPIVVPHYPSAALARSTAAGLVVEGENLEFTCQQQRCRVEALYRITAADGAELDFEFLLPTPEPVLAWVDDRPAPSTVEPAADLPVRMQRDFPDPLPDRTLQRARFRGSIHPGHNTIRVAYDQPLAQFETDYGYFKDGRFVTTLQYELWPLKEWTLAEGFSLRLTVKLEREPPNWFKRAFGDPKSFVCRGDDGKPLPGHPEQRGRYLEQVLSLGPQFPDRLVCVLADEDLLPESSQ